MIKKKLIGFLFLFVIIVNSCSTVANATPQKVIVAGKIDNYDPNTSVSLIVNRLGFSNEVVDFKIDSEGNFYSVFETDIPLDAWMAYKTNFLIQLNPNDSLYIHFNGSPNNRPEILSTIRFGGSNVETNQFIAKFQQMYYSNEIYYDWDKKNKAIKEYEPDEYIKYNDSIRQKGMAIYDQFVQEFSPNEQSKKWASFFIEDNYYGNIAFYPGDHRTANNMGRNNMWTVPQGFFEVLGERLPISTSNLMNAYSLNSYAGRFSYYVDEKLRALRDQIEVADWGIMPSGGLIAATESFDSIRIHSIVEYVPDVLLKEVMLTKFFNSLFEKQDIVSFEKYNNLVETHITQPFLKEPLYKRYIETKNRIEMPELHTETILKEVASSAVNEIFDEILGSNKGKVIYIDFWATWCAPCLGEMPSSKQIEYELRNQDVSFIYICLESEKEKYLATISKYQLGGQHYFLSKEQSRDIRALFEIQGIPFYVLIDKKGTIRERGSHLRPLPTKAKIIEMLK